MQVKIDGLSSLMAKLNYLGGNVDTAIDNGLHKGALKIQSDAKRACPYDTGRLKGSISIERIAEKSYAVGTNVEYAPYVEYGTGQRGDPSVEHTTARVGTYPHPFLMPALVANQSYVYKSCQAELLKAIKGAMNRR